MKLRELVKYSCTFIIVLFILAGLLFASSLIPQNKISRSLEQTAEYQADRDVYTYLMNQKECSVQDNYADSILLGIIWNIDETHPITSTIQSKFYSKSDYANQDLLTAVKEKKQGNMEYSRYWHGSMMIMRPLLVFFTLEQIHYILAGLLLVLTAVIGILLCRRHQMAVFIIYLLGLIGVHSWVVPFCLEYASTYLIMSGMVILCLCMEKRGTVCLTQLMILSGTATAFFDFLTTETICFTVPFVILLLVWQQERRIEEQGSIWKLLIQNALAFGISYVLTFLIKWLLAMLVSGKQAFLEAFHQAVYRVGGQLPSWLENESFLVRLLKAPIRNIGSAFGKNADASVGSILICLLLVLAVLGAFWYLFRGKKVQQGVSLPLLALMLVPIFRYMVLSNHSYVHYFFTYRALAASIMALLGLVWIQLDFSILKKK